MNQNAAAKTTRMIALWLLAFYSLCLFTALITAIGFHFSGNIDSGNLWYSVFKDGIALLAGALATVIGYYFGNRNTDVAFETAREATAQVRDAEQRTVEAEAKSENLKMEIMNVARQDDPVDIFSSPLNTESGLVLPEEEE